jgi:hypothetical protein
MCLQCAQEFGIFKFGMTKDNCRACGYTFCISCLTLEMELNQFAQYEGEGEQRVCEACFALAKNMTVEELGSPGRKTGGVTFAEPDAAEVSALKWG